MLYDDNELLALGRAYAAATGTALSGISRKALGNNNTAFRQLARGRPLTTTSAAELSRWFDDNWHLTGVPWPLGSRAA